MFWTDAWSLSASIWRNAVSVQETALASQSVIRHRGGVIDAALRNPLDADLVELGRMVPEKLQAFSEAGAVMMQGWMSLQSDYLAQMQDLASLALPSTAPIATLNRVGARASRMTRKMGNAGGEALAPVHAAATANDRRLRKVRSKAI